MVKLQSSDKKEKENRSGKVSSWQCDQGQCQIYLAKKKSWEKFAYVLDCKIIYHIPSPQFSLSVWLRS